jgi:hypothetical protein
MVLISERRRVRERLNAVSDATPLTAPVTTHAVTVTLDLASDRDGTITPVERQVALPKAPSVRARALLERLMAEYALPESEHPLCAGPAVDDVFLVRLAAVKRASVEPSSGDGSTGVSWANGELAVINLRGSFLRQHPSGVQAEMLSLLSMLGTLHANFPEISQIQFVVDGKSQETLAGHVDLQRVYPAIDTAVRPASLQPDFE